MTDRPVNSRL